MRAILVVLDEPGDPRGLWPSASRYTKMWQSSLPLHLYVRRQFERAVLMAATGRDVVALVSALEALILARTTTRTSPRRTLTRPLFWNSTTGCTCKTCVRIRHAATCKLCAATSTTSTRPIVDLFERVGAAEASLESPHSTSRTLVREHRSPARRGEAGRGTPGTSPLDSTCSPTSCPRASSSWLHPGPAKPCQHRPSSPSSTALSPPRLPSSPSSACTSSRSTVPGHSACGDWQQ